MTELGFSPEEAVLFCHLYERGTKTALQLSRELKLPRTRVYRILESLLEKGFLNELVEYNSRRFETASLKRFDHLLTQKQTELADLQRTIPFIKDQFNNLPQYTGPESKIVRYRGLTGVEQINWNSTKAHGTLHIFEQAQQLERWLPHSKAERLREEFHANGVKVKQILSVSEIPDYTQITGHVDDTTSRYINPKIMALSSDLIIYDNVVASYSQSNSDIFGVELYDQFISSILKQMFMHFWQKAKRMQKISPYGALKLG